MRQRAYIGLGANLGDPVAQILAVLNAMRQMPDMNLLLASSLYASAPIDAPGQPDFVNGVAMIETALPPLPLLHRLLELESSFGRVRSFQNAPRTLDLDLLLYAAETVDLPELRLPHPRMHLRRFVLEPLMEIAADATIPGRGAVKLLLQGLADQQVRRITP